MQLLSFVVCAAVVMCTVQVSAGAEGTDPKFSRATVDFRKEAAFGLHVDNDSDGCVDEREAIAALHGELDDNSDGAINALESMDYLETHKVDGTAFKRRQTAFHAHDSDRDGNDFISVNEMQTAWNDSMVRHWSTRDVQIWMENIVGLPQYGPLFFEMNIDGKKLPLFALQRGKLLESVLHITDARHREQIATRITLDVVFSSRTAVDPWASWMTTLLVTVIILFTCALYLYKRKHAEERALQSRVAHLNEEMEKRTAEAKKAAHSSSERLKREMSDLKRKLHESSSSSQRQRSESSDQIVQVLLETYEREREVLDTEGAQATEAWRTAKEEFEKRHPSNIKALQMWRRPEDQYRKMRRAIESSQEKQLRVQKQREEMESRWIKIEEFVVRPLKRTLNLDFYMDSSTPSSSVSSPSPSLDKGPFVSRSGSGLVSRSGSRQTSRAELLKDQPRSSKSQ